MKVVEPPHLKILAPRDSPSLLTQTPESEKVPVNPETHLPATFRIGTVNTAPLVTVPELVQHLTFLACLHRLQQDVRECPTPEGTPLSGDIKWAAFCERAALRFQDWALRQRSTLRFKLDGVDIDILMVWHTYMLNPTDFEGDRWRVAFKLPDAFPLADVVKRIDKTTYVYQRHEFVPVAPSEKHDGDTAFVPPPPAYETHARHLIEIHPVETKVRIKCFFCKREHDVPLVGTPDSPGYATTKLYYRCTNCFRYITHEKLKIRRLCDDLVVARRGNTCLAGISDFKFGRSCLTVSQCLAGTAWSMTAAQLGDYMGWSFSGIRTYVLAQAIKDRRLRPLRDQKYWGKSPKQFRRNMRASLSAIGKAYADTELFASLNLAAATQRQASFISNMERIGWLDIGRWDQGEFYLLQKAAARYHAFLDLMRAHSGAFLSPTLDIDLAWHTHQLQGSKYGRETQQFLGRTLNHDDKVADVRLKMAYDDTATLWAKRFGVPYSGCGCPIAFDAEQGLLKNHKRQFRQSTGMKFWKRAEQERDSVEAGRRFVQELLAELPEDEREAQCPSTHNMLRVHVDGKAGPTMGALRERLGVRPPDDNVDPEHKNPFAARYVFVPRRVRGSRTFGPPEPLADSKRETREERRRRERDAHNDAFLYGYPLYWGVVPYGYGVYPVADPFYCDANHRASGGAGCAAGVGAASSGACVTGESGCCGAAGISACGSAAGGCAGGSAGGCAGGSGGGGCGGGGGGGGCGGGGGGGCGGGGGGGCGGGGGS